MYLYHSPFSSTDRRDEDGEGWPQEEYVGLWQV